MKKNLEFTERSGLTQNCVLGASEFQGQLGFTTSKTVFEFEDLALPGLGFLFFERKF